jgi:hypothetical protein
MPAVRTHAYRFPATMPDNVAISIAQPSRRQIREIGSTFHIWLFNVIANEDQNGTNVGPRPVGERSPLQTWLAPPSLAMSEPVT